MLRNAQKQLEDARGWSFEDFMNAVDPWREETQAQIHARRGLSEAQSREIFESAKDKMIAIRKGQVRSAQSCSIS